jgi:hypothetical protein
MEQKKFKIEFENGKPKVDKGICLSIVCANREPEDKDEKYHFHLALEFFKNNLLSFSDQEISNVCANPYALKRLGGNFDITALQICVKNGQPFPIALPGWAGKKFKKDLLKKYITLINEKNDVQQLNFFLEHFHDNVMDFIDENTKISETLYEGLAKHLLEKKPHQNLTAIKNILVNRDISIFEYLDRKYPNDFKKLLSTSIFEANNNKVKLNVAQYLLVNKEFDSLNVIKKIFSPHKDLLLEPINNKVYLYNQKISIFEYGLTNSKLIAFAPFSLEDNLNDEQKEQVVAAAFSLLAHKYGGLNDGPYHLNYIAHFDTILQNWYSPIIEQSTNKQFSNYCKAALIGHQDNKELKKAIQTIILHRDLNTNLETNNNLTKKMKI